MTQATFRFSGPDLTPADVRRLGRQLLAVLHVMSDGRWRTLRQISDESGAPEASVSARLRDLKNKHEIAYEKKRMAPDSGLHLYRIPRPDRVRL